MKILLFNRNEQYIATLRDVLSAKHTEELNGENVLEIETLDEIEKNQRLIYKDKYGYWHEFIVRGVEEERAEEGIIRKVFAEHSFYETWGDYIEDKRPYNVPANIALSVALEPTRWEVGIVDDLGINSTNFYHISAKEAVQKVTEIWQGELKYRIEVSGNRITGRYVDLLARRGYDLGKRFTYTKDLISITKTVHRDDVITALYGYGKGEEIVDEEGQPTGGYGRRIDFADINNGKAYVENLEAKEIWGRLNPDGTKAHVFGKVEFDDVEDPHELLELTKEKLKELSQPHITYEAKVIDLKALGIEHEGVELGDWVGIVDKEFNPPLRLKARVIKIVRDLLEPENTEITLGNFVPSITDAWLEQEKFISNFRGKQGVWDRSNIIGSDGTLNTQYLDGVIDVVKTQLLATQSGWYTDDRGNLIFENADKTAAMMLTGEGFMIANSKLPNGEYNWRTFGTGNGFVADYIIAGVLKGGKVHFDLTNGTFLIGNNIEDYNLYFDGSNLSIKMSNNKSIETALTELETGLQDYADQLDGKVSKNNIISEINQTAEAIKIQASKIKLEGLVTANSNFKVLTDGSIEAKNADISGNITATSGTIGGWNITRDYIDTRDGSARMYLASHANTSPYYIHASNSSGSTMFSVSKTGVLYARNADISGKITANSGAIGGWQLTSSLIQYRPDSSNNNSRFYLNSDPTGTYRIASYNNSGTRQFSVTSDGVLYARNADISGNITATSGTIGGWNITRDYIDTRDGSARMYLASHANISPYYIHASNSSGSTMFSVSKTGVLYARDADISGKITSSAVTVTGGTITGTTIRTGSGSDRIELSNNLLRAYSGGTRRVQLDYDSLDFYTPGGNKAGRVYGDDQFLVLESENSSLGTSQIFLSPNLLSIESDWIEVSTGPYVWDGGKIMHRGLIQSGTVEITPVPNQNTGVRLYFPTRFSKAPVVVCTAHSGYPDDILEVTHSDRTSSYVDIVINRKNSTKTSVSWIAMVPEL